MELDAWIAQEETSEETKETYRYFMRPEPNEMLSDIEVEPDTGRRFRYMLVGMVRNAPDTHKQRVKVIIDPLPHIVIDNPKPLQGWYKAKAEEAGIRNRPCFTDAILTQPYGGYCAVGCSFCYINSGIKGYRGSGLITVPLNYGEHVRQQLKTMRTSAAGYFSSFTDPFLPLEDYYHNTQQGAEAFVEAGLPIFFLSRKRYPEWAMDLLKRNKYSYAQKSINTPHQADWKKLSPGAASLAEHLDDIRELRRRGIYVSIQVNPIIAGIVTHEDVELLFEMLADAGANHVIVKFVESSYNWVPAMIERHVKRFGAERAAKFKELFTQNIGGQRTVEEAYRMEGHVRYQRKATALGLTYATCYEYRYERDQAGNILNRTGVSVGRDFLTADQCHGHRVPMFTRTGPHLNFKEVEACPPTGCLHCADDNAGKPRCGSTLYGQAKALRASDLRIGVFGESVLGVKKLSV